MRSQQMRYEWRSVVEVLGPKVEGRGGTATVVDGAGAASYGVRWFERRPLAGDAVLVEIPPPGGTRRIAAIDREIDDTVVDLPIYAAKSFGIKSNGSTIDSRLINYALSEIAGNGGGVLMGIAGGVSVVDELVALEGSLVRFDLNGGTLLRVGPSTDPVIAIRTVDGALDKIVRSAVAHGTIDGGGVAQYAVHVRTANFSRIEDLTIQGGSAWQLYMDCWDSRPVGSDARDNQHNALRDLELIATGSAGGLKVHGNSDVAIAASDGANTSLNRIDNIRATVVNGDGFFWGDSDGNITTHLRLSRTGAGRGLVLAGWGILHGHARDNLFYGVQMGAGGVWALSDVEPSSNNIIFGNNLGNGGSSPNIAGAATLWYFNNDGTGNIGGGGGGPPSGAAGGDLGGTYPNPSVVQAGGQFSLAGSGNNITTTGTITDQTITNARLRWNGASAATLAGVAGGVAGRLVIVSNVTAAQILTLAHESGSEATTGNRLACPGSVDLLLNPNEAVWLFYETTSNRWRVMFRRITVSEVDALFDATTPAAIAASGSVGTATTAPHRDHVHPHEPAHVVHDTIWDTAGDLVQGTGADTAAKLAITVPAANILNVVGVVNGETSWSVKSVHDATAPTTSALADAAAAGTSLLSAHRDHRHGRESFATNAIVLGSAAAAGVATTPFRSDDTIAAFDATSPTTQAFGDAAAVGAAAFAARRDHKHAMPNSTAGPDADVTIDVAGAAGTAATAARSGHGHKLATSATAAVALGAAAAGTSGHSPSRDDHVHPTTGLSLNPHGAADHTDITRTVWLDAASAKLDSGTAATLGTAPNSTPVIAFADAATQGCFWDVSLPADWGSGTLIFRPMWAPGATDATPHTARFSLDVKSMAAGDDVTAAGTTVAQTGASAARTANLLVSDNTIDSTVTPSSSANVVRVNIRRVGADAADTYVGVVNLLGLRLSYTANQ